MDDGSPIARARTAPELIGQLSGDLSGLLRKESELMRTELAESVNRAGKAVGDIAAGGLLLIAALLVLLQTLVLTLSKYMDPIWASLLVAVGVAAVGYVMLRAGRKSLSLENLKPKRSARQLKKDAEIVKGNPK
jgi:hypothetical protein